MKMKKKSIFILAAVLYAAVIFMACQNPLGGSDAGRHQPAPGHGYARLNLGGMRAILPDPVASLEGFTYFELRFVASGSDGQDFTVVRPRSEINDPVDLWPGQYTLNVTAFVGAAIPENEAARAIDIYVPRIIAGQMSPIVIILYPIPIGEDPAHTGTFSWNITLNNNIGTLSDAHFTVTPVPGGYPTGGYTFTPQSLSLGANAGNHRFPTGYYNVEFTITREDENGNDESFVFRQVLWVYRNLVSHFEIEFTLAHFASGLLHTVTFNALGFPGMPATSTEDVIQGHSVTLPTVPSTPMHYVFGWFSERPWWTTWSNWWELDWVDPFDDSYWGDSLVGQIPNVTQSMEVFLRWAPRGAAVASPGDNIILDGIGGTPFQFSYQWWGTVSSGQGTPTDRGTVTVPRNSDLSFRIVNSHDYWGVVSTIEWRWNNYILSTSSDLWIYHVATPGNPSFITTGSRGSYLISVTAIATPSNRPQSASFTLVVE